MKNFLEKVQLKILKRKKSLKAQVWFSRHSKEEFEKAVETSSEMYMKNGVTIKIKRYTIKLK